MTAIPAMMLWTDAYMADTSHLTTTENGAYLLILMAMWRAGGTLPNDDVKLARYARLRLDHWHRIAPVIREFLTVEDGVVYQKRLRRELQIATYKAEKHVSSGRAGGLAKSLKNNKPIPSAATSDAKQTLVAEGKQPSSLSDPESESDPELEKKEEEIESAKPPLAVCSKHILSASFFNRFYKAYPKRVNPKAAEKKFEAVVKSGIDPELIIAAAERFSDACSASKTEKQFIKAPDVWLNKGCYYDEDLPQRSSNGRTVFDACREDAAKSPDQKDLENAQRLNLYKQTFGGF